MSDRKPMTEQGHKKEGRQQRPALTLRAGMRNHPVQRALKLPEGWCWMQFDAKDNARGYHTSVTVPVMTLRGAR